MAQSALGQSARSLGMANASSGLKNEWAVFHNAAGLAWHDRSFTCASALNHYFLKELTLKNAAAGWIKNGKALALSLAQSGDYRLKISKVAALYGQRFGESFSMGGSMTYEELAFSKEYGKKNILYFSFGFLVALSPADHFAFNIENPGRQTIDARTKEKLETSIVSSYTHEFSGLFTGTAEIDKKLGSDVNFKLGFEYWFKRVIAFRAGYELAFHRSCFGLTFVQKKLNLDVAFSYERKLGFNSAIGASYSFNCKS